MIRRIVIAFALSGALGFSSSSQAKLRFESRTLTVAGVVLAVTTGDIDGNGEPDLVVSHARGAGPRTTKFLSIFLRKTDGFAARPDITVHTPKNAALFDVGDAFGDPADELLFLAADGVYAMPIVRGRPGRPTRVIEAAVLVGAPEEDDLVSWDFLRTVGARDAVVVPTARALEIYRRDRALWKLESSVQVDLQSFYRAGAAAGRQRSRRGGSRGFALEVTTIVPALAFVEQTGDAHTDLVATYRDRVAVYPGRADGTITATASHHRWLRLLTPEELQSRDTYLEVKVLDLDGDGIADISATKVGGGITNLTTETQLFRGVRGGGFEQAPAQRFTDDGFASLIEYRDLDGDGRVEMIHPYSAVSILALSRVLLSSQLALDIRIRRPDKKSGIFERTPGGLFDTLLGFDFSVGGSLRGAYPVFGGDFDGDGRQDVVVSRSKQSMQVRHGDAAEFFREDGAHELSAPATPHTSLIERGGNNPPDILLAYPNRPDQIGKLIVFHARREP